MALLQLTTEEWRGTYRALSRQKRGKPNARIPSKDYPWTEEFILIHGEQENDAPLLTVAAADVLNSAVVQKHSLQDALGIAYSSSSTRVKEVMILMVGSGTS
jgi:hypothetical protein